MNIFKSGHQSEVKGCFIQSVIRLIRLIVDHICKNKYPDPDNQHKWTGTHLVGELALLSETGYSSYD